MAVDTKPWTRAELQRLPADGNRYEVLDGRLLVTPQASFAHQRVALQLTIILDPFVRAAGIATVVGPGAVLFGENELQPDVQVIPGPPSALEWNQLPAPLLVVEVLSRSSQRHDRGVKLDAYLRRVGVETVWLVDLHERGITSCTVRGAEVVERTERELISWHPAGAPAPLVVNIPQLFRDALGN